MGWEDLLYDLNRSASNQWEHLILLPFPISPHQSANQPWSFTALLTIVFSTCPHKHQWRCRGWSFTLLSGRGFESSWQQKLLWVPWAAAHGSTNKLVLCVAWVSSPNILTTALKKLSMVPLLTFQDHEGTSRVNSKQEGELGCSPSGKKKKTRKWADVNWCCWKHNPDSSDEACFLAPVTTRSILWASRWAQKLLIRYGNEPSEEPVSENSHKVFAFEQTERVWVWGRALLVLKWMENNQTISSWGLYFTDPLLLKCLLEGHSAPSLENKNNFRDSDWTVILYGLASIIRGDTSHQQGQGSNDVLMKTPCFIWQQQTSPVGLLRALERKYSSLSCIDITHT